MFAVKISVRSSGSCRVHLPRRTVLRPASPHHALKTRVRLPFTRYFHNAKLGNFRLQPLQNQHLYTAPLSAHSKELTVHKIHPQPLNNQHLESHLLNTENQQLITSLESALTQSTHINFSGINTYEKQGEGGSRPPRANATMQPANTPTVLCVSNNGDYTPCPVA